MLFKSLYKPLGLLVLAVFSTQTFAESKNQNETFLIWLKQVSYQHPSVVSAKTRIKTAKLSASVAAKPLYNPELEFDIESAGGSTLVVGYKQTIDWGDTRSKRTSQAKAQQSVSQFALESKVNQVATSILIALSQYETAIKLQKLAKEETALIHRSVNIAKSRFKAGDISKVDLDFASLALAQAKFREADSIAQLNEHIISLMALTSQSQNQWMSLSGFSLTGLLDGDDENSTLLALPEMKKIMAEVKVARANVKFQQVVNQANPSFGVRLGKEPSNTLVGVSVSIPLNVRNDFSSNISLAQAQVLEVESQSKVIYRQLSAQLSMAKKAYQLNEATWKAWQKSGAGTLNKQIQLLEKLWQLGELSTTNYLVQLTQTLETKTSAAEQRGKMNSSKVKWLSVSGKLLYGLKIGKEQ